MKWDNENYRREDLEEYFQKKLLTELNYLSAHKDVNEMCRAQGRCAIYKELISLVGRKDGFALR